jgi:hypothetical protein
MLLPDTPKKVDKVGAEGGAARLAVTHYLKVPRLLRLQWGPQASLTLLALM